MLTIIDIGTHTDKWYIKILNANTSGVTNMKGMFIGCLNLKEIEGLNKFDTNNVTDMCFMFHECTKLTEIEGLENLNTSNVENMSYMFNECKGLKEIKGLDKWNTGNVTNMNYMFSNCISLKSLCIRSYTSYNYAIQQWEIKQNCETNSMFKGCSSLQNIDELKNFIIEMKEKKSNAK